MTHAQMYALPSAWEQSIDEWCKWLKVAGTLPTSIRTRRGTVRRVARLVNTEHPELVVARELVSILADQVWSNYHRRSVRTSLDLFYIWACHIGIVSHNPVTDVPVVSEPEPKPRPAPDWVWTELVTDAGPRELVMARLGCEAGLRASEIARVHTDDLQWDGEGYSLCIIGKGEKQRLVPLTDELADIISRGPEEWAPGCHRGWLFPNLRTGGHITGGHVTHLLSGLMPETWTGHKLRHRYATRGFAGTKNLRAVQIALGHASVSTTQRYTAVNSEDVRAVTMAAVSRQGRLGT